MSQSDNVVTFGLSGEASGLPSSLIRLRDRTSARFRNLLAEFFDSADDALFDLSDRALSNAEQSTYFDAMRELRMQRKSISLAFQQWLGKAFDEGGCFDPLGSSGYEAATDRDSLSLVDDETLEEQVAIDNMVLKIRNRYSEPVELLRLRIAQLLGNQELASAQNPLGPEVICHGLAQSCAGLDIDIRSRLVIFKLFDRLLVGSLGQLYSDANQHLIDEGVLPKLKNPSQVQGGRAAAAATRNSAGGSAENSEGDQVYTLKTLTELMHTPGVGATGGLPGMPLTGAPGAGMGQADTRELVQLLSRVQFESDSVPAAQSQDTLSLSFLVQQLVSEQKKGVEQDDSDVINLVSMLFDFILDDRQLPETMKALIARLQIPLVKVALVDREFFNRGGHPARRLLNELASAAMSWSDDDSNEEDPLLRQVESTVARVLNEFNDDPAVFQDVLDDFCAFMEKDRRRRELVEKRIRDAEEGRARDEQAREAAESLIAGYARDRSVPESICGFLNDAWVRVLKWHWLREGADSAAWQSICDTTERLVWSIDPQPRTRSTRPALLREIPRVVGQVRQGLKAISWDSFEVERILRDMELIHVDVLQKLNTAPDEVSTESTESGVTESAGGFDITDSAPPGLEQAEAVSVEATPEAVANEAAATTDEAKEPKPAGPDPKWLRYVDELGVGAWMEWRASGEDSVVRCKLAAVIRATGKYIFVNRSGARVAQFWRDDLAQAMASGELQMLDDGMIFDRALESVIDNLRSRQRQ